VLSALPHPPHQIEPDGPTGLAAGLLGAACLPVVPVHGGGNSRVYRVQAADGRRYALKCYPDPPQDPRDRLGREWRALALLRQHGIDCVPQPVAHDPQRHAALYDWIEGEPVHGPGPAELADLVDFLARTHALGRTLAEDAAGPASHACPTPAHLSAQAGRRLERLLQAGPPAAARDFLERELAPLLAREAAGFLEATAAAGLDPCQPAAPVTLSPADTGFHNALATDRGLVFLDLEYFGWDDPAKLVADVLLHPRGAPPAPLRPRFLSAAAAIYGADDPDFLPRLRRSLPLLGLVWCLILLNELLPEGLRRRLRAAHGTADARAAQARQLARARALLRRVPALADALGVS
jgi:hypothetical protein